MTIALPALKGATNTLERLGTALKRRGYGRSSMGRALIDAILYPSDLRKILGQYRSVFGRLPRLRQPITFNEHLQSYKLFCRKAHHTAFADKLMVRDFVRDRIGGEVLTAVYWIGTDLCKARALPLPPKFVLKANHGSGYNMVVTDAKTFDWESAKGLTRTWLETDFSTWSAEYQYRWINPKLFIEQYLGHSDGRIPPPDYKFFCFHGRVELIQVDVDRFTSHARALYDRDFNSLPVAFAYPRPQEVLSKPACFESMFEMAECLASDEPFLRVDFYDVGKPIFGELTLHPEAGFGIFDPPEWDERLGALLREGRKRPVK
jgi:hypothetical protein